MKALLVVYLLLMIFQIVHAESGPLFPTGISFDQDGHMVISEKGRRRVAVYSNDGRSLLRTYEMADVPTGVLCADGKIFVTTFEVKGMLHVLDAKDGSEIACIETGSGACCPLADERKGLIYVCNQFQNTISEIDMKTMKLMI